jgi:alkylhydroperoxidase/carboxymuconolactone decarboxylase family protein YurZ
MPDVPATLLGDQAEKALSQDDPQWLERIRDLERETLRGVLSPTTTMLVQLIVHASVTGLSESHVRRFVRGALKVGVTREQILAVLKLCTILGIHAAAQAAPILSECLARSGTEIKTQSGRVPTIQSMRSNGEFNDAWEELEKWDPVWLDRFLSVGLAKEIKDVLGPHDFELLCIAIDASVSHLYNPGTRRHIDAALRIGVSPEEILEVIKLVSIHGIRSIDVGIQILEDEYRV